MKYTDSAELIDAVLTYGLEELENASEELLRDRDIILELVREYEGDYRDVLQYVSEELRNDENFVLKLSNLKNIFGRGR